MTTTHYPRHEPDLGRSRPVRYNPDHKGDLYDFYSKKFPDALRRELKKKPVIVTGHKGRVGKTTDTKHMPLERRLGIMMGLIDASPGIGLQECSDKMDVGRTRVSTLAGMLDKRGLIRREYGPRNSDGTSGKVEFYPA